MVFILLSVLASYLTAQLCWPRGTRRARPVRPCPVRARGFVDTSLGPLSKSLCHSAKCPRGTGGRWRRRHQRTQRPCGGLEGPWVRTSCCAALSRCSSCRTSRGAWASAWGSAGSSSSGATLTERFIMCNCTIFTFRFAVTVSRKTSGAAVV